jgi:hypothetical protein
MNPMPERPENIPTTPAARLAERYGMTPEAIEAIIRGTAQEYPKTTPQSDLPPTSPHEALIEQAASTLSESDTMAKSSKDNPTAPTAKPPVKTVEKKSIGGALLAGIFTLLLIALAVVASLQRGCFRQRHPAESLKPIDTIQSLLTQQAERASTPPQSPTQSSPNEVPPEALVVPREEPPGTSGTASNSGITKEAKAEKSTGIAGRPELSTSSNFEAEERLAELHANGARKAHMKAVRKGNAMIYKIYRH